jgi:hypothetical protein
MKKFLVILLLMVYGVSSSGATLHLHFCCGKLDKVDLVPVEKKSCGKDHKGISKSCCNDQQVQLKIHSDYRATEAVKNFFKTVSFTPPLFSLSTATRRLEQQAIWQWYHPPTPSTNPLYILHSVYRI